MNTINWEQLARERQVELQKIKAEQLQQAQLIEELRNRLAEVDKEKEELSIQLEELGFSQESKQSSSPSKTNQTLLQSYLEGLTKRIYQLETLCTSILEENRELKKLLTQTSQSQHPPVNTALITSTPQPQPKQDQSMIKEVSLPTTLPAVKVDFLPNATLVKSVVLQSPTQAKSPSLNLSDHMITSQRLNDYTGRTIIGYTFMGNYYKTYHWIDLLTSIANLIAKQRSANFDKCLQLQSGKGKYFSRNKKELRKPRLIEGFNIYLEANHSADTIVKITYDLINLFGYSENDLRIESRPSK